MTASRGRGVRPGGVVRALARLVLLVALGFGVGLLFGIVLEEPQLLAGHLRGESESVEIAGTGRADAASGEASDAGGADSLDPAVREALSTDAASGVLPRVAAAGPEATADATQTERRPPARPRPMIGASLDGPDRPGNARPVVASTPSVPPSARSVAAATAPDRAWSIQVGAFAEEASANRLAAGLRDRYPVAVLPASGAGGRWRVRIQPIAEEAEARSTAERLKREERLPTWVTRMEGRSGS